ncbi:ribosomal protein S6 kinase delta-1 [Uranotaenia lowii]|uniref:ribosomal protein S6 kinase delta-1 n=1 Tax=Uranotaenia lowii TaxID=190385 RepID=UPI00247ADC52|nr:ribosomal protein S6 kinase delta-1 [Uranotaenia lowii]XP_055613345.1 ribosomal protein S6 kinase delta-1 [Uranotaenia lowii]
MYQHLLPKIPDWMHHFEVTETRKYKSYTIYKITSIVFPRHLPEALTSITLWKRFSDVKQLYKDLARKHRERHLAGRVPVLTEKTYFKRFDVKVIEQRKRYILELLTFAGQDPVLFQSYPFVRFFERGISPEGSPVKDRGVDGGGGSIAAICEDLAIPVPQDFVLIDPTRDDGDESEESGPEEDYDGSSSVAESIRTGSGSMVDSMISHASSERSGGGIGGVVGFNEVGRNDTTGGEIMQEKDESLDYIVEAAIIFSKAAEAEANGRYKVAFNEYKAGIDRLLLGSKNDSNATRKKIAKEKTCKYVTRAEEIYEKHLLHQEDDEILQLSPISVDDPSSPIQLLERPLNYLSRYKVVRVLEGRIMQVQDVTDRKFYIMKSIRKPPGGFCQAMFLPHGVPYMVPLVAYFQSEVSVFLLMKLICGGKLWDYICRYRGRSNYSEVEELPGRETLVEEAQAAENKNVDISNESDSSQTTGYDSGFIDLVNDYSGKINAEEMANGKTEQVLEDLEEASEAVDIDEVDCCRTDPEGEESNASGVGSNGYIPSFDVLSKDMDVKDLVSCSQQLLRAVSQTLEDSHQQPSPKMDALLPIVVNGERLNKSSVIPPRPLLDTTTTSQLEFRKPNSIEIDPLPEGCIKQWISELVISVDNLHFNGIICGDLTMDNLLLGPEGQLMLTYFYRKERFPNMTTLTAELRPEAVHQLYVAPERPLQARSDYWSIGVILFEMLTRKSFLSCHPAGVFCYHEIQFPEGVVISEEAKDLLEGLLQPLPENRFDFKEVIASSFFHTIDWSEVKRRGQM